MHRAPVPQFSPPDADAAGTPLTSQLEDPLSRQDRGTPQAGPMNHHSLPRSPADSAGTGQVGTRQVGTGQAAAAESVLLITDDDALREDIALITAVVGVRLETATNWRGAEEAEGWAAVMCSAQCLPTSARQAEGTLLLGYDAEGLWEAAAQLPGVRPVPLPQAERWLSKQLSAQVFDRSQGKVVAAASTAGGAGSTTFAYLCAAELVARGQRPLLIDAALGPGSGLADLVHRARSQQRLGSGNVEGGDLDWEQLSRIEGEISTSHLSAAIPIVDGIGVLTGSVEALQRTPLLPAAAAAGRSAFDVVIIDLGQRIEMTHIMGEQLERMLVVTRASPRAAETAVRLVRAVAPVEAAVVVNRRAAPGWGPEDLADRLGAPVVADLAEQRWLARTDDLADTYQLLRSARGARMIHAVLHALGLGDA